jgi:hypothetical protein
MIYLKEYEFCKTKDALKSGLFEVGLNNKSYVFWTECTNVSETDIQIYLKSHNFDKIPRKPKYGVSFYYSFKDIMPVYKTKKQQAMVVILPLVSIEY